MSDQGRLVAGRYRLVELIGRGGMGTVWRSEDELLGRQVAVKKLRVPPQLHDDERETLYERTRREARSAARITHPNVVVVHDVVEDEGLPCIVMEYVRSRTLGDVLKKDGPVTPREAARIGRGMVAALRAAHRAGVLHRDVKPANVLLSADGPEGDASWPGGRVVLTDFGIASATGTSTLTRTGELIGSFDFLAPERITGGTGGPACDLWALGATLYQAVEGVAPFHRDTPIETAYAIASEPVPTPRRAGALAPVIESLLEKDPDKRMSAEQAERLLVSSVETVAVTGNLPRRPAPSWALRDGVDDQPTAVVRPRTAAAVEPSAAVPEQRQEPDPHGTQDTQGGSGAQDHHDTHSVHGPQSAEDVTAQVTAPPADVTAVAAAASAAPLTIEPTPRLDAPERPDARRTGRGKRVAAWCGAAVVAAAAVVGGLLLAQQDSGASQGGQAADGNAAQRPSAAPPTAPPGYHVVDDPAGFTMVVPNGWTRQVDSGGRNIHYVDVQGKCDLLVSVEDYAGPSALQHFRDLEVTLKADNNGYSVLRMNSTQAQINGEQVPAAIWEWTWNGKVRKYHAIDLGFGKEGGTEYAVYLSAPDAEWQQRLPVFNNAAKSFQPHS
ncbi:serine/threonine-protein kinase [Streptantibioticus ferralitis]|uniref:non-specific serine/threonine protein kinase n=1 Tax=Streptantibioticus ferralitis TaxID=236510 RepID=A0ABT5Z2G1_9ACTN|nr:serine/threonine-protein kinase [Streptantibioticus ferralitis]MDF2257953.1 serine/threonine-protein kinase [Streptantibioticus ferralitis]